jgi:hypothetical protein
MKMDLKPSQTGTVKPVLFFRPRFRRQRNIDTTCAQLYQPLSTAADEVGQIEGVIACLDTFEKV